MSGIIIFQGHHINLKQPGLGSFQLAFGIGIAVLADQKISIKIFTSALPLGLGFILPIDFSFQGCLGEQCVADLKICSEQSKV